MKIYRNMCRAYIKPGSAESLEVKIKNETENIKEIMDRQKWSALSLFIYEDILILYNEHQGDGDPNGIFPDIEVYLQDIIEKSGQKWRTMWDIFHYCGIKDFELWQRKVYNKEAQLRINYVLPEMFSSYVFYHYQLQEERPGDSDKYGIICFDDGLMGFYEELPVELDENPIPGKLSTNNTPADIWQEFMCTHFIPWKDYDEPWRPMRNIFSVIPYAT